MAVLYPAQLRCVPLSDVLFPELFAGSTENARHARPPVVFSEDHADLVFAYEVGFPDRLLFNCPRGWRKLGGSPGFFGAADSI